jgi:histidine ammonia-lyase
MGTIAARKAREICLNTSRVLAIELITAAQAIDLNTKDRGKSLGKGTKAAYDEIRRAVQKVDEDRELYLDFKKAAVLIDSNVIVDAVETAVGKLN